MASLTADDIIKRLSSMATGRSDFEHVWRQARDVAAPDAPDFTLGGLGTFGDTLGIQRANAARTSAKIYDATGVWAVDRLASGLEGLIMPQSETWHTLLPQDLITATPTDEEAEWLEGLRDFLFRVRYDAQSGWQTALQTCLRRLVTFGNGFMFVEEGFEKSLVRYRHLPLPEVYIAQDAWSNVDTMIRVYPMSARQARQKWGDKISAQLKTVADDPAQADRTFRFIHYIGPRGDFGGGYAGGTRRARYASVHVEFETRHVIGEGGYFEFPLIDFRWLPEREYGEGPIMRVLADIQSMQLMAKNEMIASQQSVDPPLLVARHGIINRPNSNPGEPIVGGIDANGRQMVAPLNLGQRVDFAQAVIQAKRQNLRESLYINLFALMVENPRMSATEALIRANEKGELLGPAGSRIQESLAKLVDRELGILARKGIYEPTSVFFPPRTLQNREIGPKFTSPLDRLRRAKDAEAVIRTLEITAPIMQIKPEIADNMDGDETFRGVAEVVGMPRRFLKRREEVAQDRAQRAAEQAQQQQLAATMAAAEAAGKAAPALEAIGAI